MAMNETLFESLPDRVQVYEVSPRDGLQNEAVTVPTPAKVRLIEALVNAGLKRLEATSFVSPKWVPQLSDAEQLARFLPKPAGLGPALCPNRQGLERALTAGIDEIAVFLSVSETHNKKNVNKSVAETLAAFQEVAAPALERGLKVRAYLSTLWGCPYEGNVDPRRGVEITRRLFDLGCYEVSLGDTIGVELALDQEDREDVLVGVPVGQARAALSRHSRNGVGELVMVGMELGLGFDASIAGLGGCPYAPGAAGNLATEDLVYTLDGMGVETGIDLKNSSKQGESRKPWWAAPCRARSTRPA